MKVCTWVLLAAAAAPAADFPGALATPIGVTREGEPILAHVDPDRGDAVRILLVGGLRGGSPEEIEAAWAGRPSAYSVSAVWVEHPDSQPQFPPPPDAYQSETHAVSQYLWRWIGTHAPDLVVEIGAESSGLAEALGTGAPAGIGSIPAVRVKSLSAWPRVDGPSQARREIERRLARSPLEVARELAAVYGHALPQVVYIPAVALIGRLRLGELSGDASHLADVQRIADPYLDGQPTLDERVTSSHLPGHLIFGELARATGDARYLALAKRAADLGFRADGSPKESMPFHNEMSDSVFMGCAILAQVGDLTGDSKYFDMALRHLRFMEALDRRGDGLYRHSPLDEAAWGRGNGFPALGLALALSWTPEDHRAFQPMLDSFRSHVDALLEHQDAGGMWHQVIDRPESYRELTATSMIGFSLLRGYSKGWLLGDRYREAATRAWEAVKPRIGSDGGLIDVCTGTGKQESLRAYFDRKAILGRDDRGGAMALLFAVETAATR